MEEAFKKDKLVSPGLGLPYIIDEFPESEAEVDFPNAFFRLGDTLTPAEYASFLHWLVINIPGRDISRGDHYVAFMGSAPPDGSGIHRYVFLVFKQTKKLELTESELTYEQCTSG